MVDNLEEALPPGAIPSDVADDQTAKVSEGEFIVPANVVRFIGVEKLESMVQKATTSLSEMEEAGRMGNADNPVEPPAFAEGGLVAPVGMELKTYKGPNNETLLVPYKGGAPIINVPEGYTETTKNTNPNTANVSGGGLVRSQASQDGTGYDAEKVGLNKDVSDWDVEDFDKYSKSVSTSQGRIANTAVSSVASIMGLGGIMNAAEKNKGKLATQAMDQMLSTGKDLKGATLSPEQMSSVQASKSAIANPEQKSVAEKVVGTGINVAGRAMSGSGLVGSVVGEAAATASEKVTGHRNPVKGLIGKALEPVRSAIETTFSGRKAAQATAKKEEDKEEDDKKDSSGRTGSSDKTDATSPTRSSSTSSRSSTGSTQHGVSGSAAPGRDN